MVQTKSDVGVVLTNIPASLTRLAYLRLGAVIGDVTAKMEVMKLTVRVWTTNLPVFLIEDVCLYEIAVMDDGIVKTELTRVIVHLLLSHPQTDL